MSDALNAFDPIVASWFREELGQPSDIQLSAWAAIAAGEHVLAMAPTGSGKTLAAFLWALDSLISGQLPADRLSVLYISPLKALNNDIRRNLISPINSLHARFRAAGRPFPALHVSVRSGDTSQAERRSFLKKPAAILATTPESFALLLNSPKGRAVLSTVALLVLDEVHALCANKRGALLALNVERLGLLAGSYRRVALSATVANVAAAAAYVGGYVYRDELSDRPLGPAGSAVSASPVEPSAGKSSGWDTIEEPIARPVRVLRSSLDKRTEFSIRMEGPSFVSKAQNDGASRWASLADAFVQAVEAKRSTLIFANSRRNAEKTAFLMNERAGREIAWAHHGSLSREVRRTVEERLKNGLLPAVVATNSLELGIDIGSVDEVLMAGTPPSVASALQRAGRAAHRLGGVSRARIYPLHGLDLLFAAGLVREAEAGRIEAEAGPEAPLDVLAQALLALCALDDWNEIDLYRFVRRSSPFYSLKLVDYRAVLAMLRGRYEETRLGVLRSRLDPDAPPGILRATSAVLPLLYRSGGAIPDRGYYRMELAGSRAPVGELDEEFVWERRLGDSFALGTRTWRILAIDDRAVTVTPGEGGLKMLPFWRADSQWRRAESLSAVLELLDAVPEAAENKASIEELSAEAEPNEDIALYLESKWKLDQAAARFLAAFLARQRRQAGLPGKGRLVLECFRDPMGQGAYAFLHTVRGGRVNAVLGIALRALAEQRGIDPLPETYWDDVGLLMAFPALENEDVDPNLISALLLDLASTSLSGAFRAGLEGSGLFGAVFRENAGRAMLLPKASFGKRTPLWITRHRSKNLYEAVRRYSDFPIIKETWRACLRDHLDAEGAKNVLEGLASGGVDLRVVIATAPSPFTEQTLWQASDSFMYRRDEGGARSASEAELLTEMLNNASVPPELDREALEELSAKRRRLAQSYRPRTVGELLDWLDERQIISGEDWEELIHSIKPQSEELPKPLKIRLRGAKIDLALAPAAYRLIREANGQNIGLDAKSVEFIDPAQALRVWAEYEGLISGQRLSDHFGVASSELASFAAAGGLRPATLSGEEGVSVWLTPSFLEFSLRRTKSLRRSRLAKLGRPLVELQLRVIRRQGLLGFKALDAASDASIGEAEGGANGIARLEDAEKTGLALEPIFGVALDYRVWEGDVLPARLQRVALEPMLRETSIVWYGRGGGRLAFIPEDEFLELTLPHAELDEDSTRLLETMTRGEGLTVPELAVLCGQPESEIRPFVARLAALGRLTADSWEAAKRSFAAEGAVAPSAASPARGAFSPRRPQRPSLPTRARWLSRRASEERWRVLPSPASVLDPLSALERHKTAVRRYIKRYGLICRSLVELDADPSPWRELYRASRLMEFAGELTGGHFYAELDELQFMRREEALELDDAPELLEKHFDDDSGDAEFYCLCAVDPASLCALAPLSSRLKLPARLASNHVVWRELTPVLVSRREGRELDFRVSAEDKAVEAAIRALVKRLKRPVTDSASHLIVESINGLSSRLSPYSVSLNRCGFKEAVRGLEYVPSCVERS